MKASKKILLILTQILAVLGFVFVASNEVEARELTGAVSDISIWKPNYKSVEQTNGVYELLEDVSYTFQVSVDLTENGSNVADGDYFTFDIPAPYSVSDETFDLLDEGTGIAVGAATVTSAGQGQGGRVVITLKNIQTYLEQKKADEVLGIKGTFYVNFSSKATSAPQTTTFPNMKDPKALTINVSRQGEAPDNSDALGRENIAKYAGVLSNSPYTSAALGKSGEWQHPWAMRVNASRKSYDSLTITDSIDQSASSSQFIPETVQLLASDAGFDFNYALQNAVTLTPGVDYTVTYNSDHSQMVINVPNAGSRAFYLTYGTTAPADGTFVGNSYELSSTQGPIPVHDGTPETRRTVTRQSLLTQGGTIELEIANRITVQKVDEETGSPLAGAIFKITKPDGTEITLEPTDSNGVTQTPSFTTAEMEAGDFTITEVSAPEGYEIDPTPRTVKVTQAGIVEKFTNKKVGVIVSPPASSSSTSDSTSESTSDSSSSTSSTSDSSTSTTDSTSDSSSTSTSESAIVNAPGADDNSSSSTETSAGGSVNETAGSKVSVNDAETANVSNVSNLSRRRTLPNTGEKSQSLALAAGTALLILAGGLLLVRRRNS